MRNEVLPSAVCCLPTALFLFCATLFGQIYPPAAVSVTENRENPVGLMRLHLAWGWGTQTAWNGTVSLTEGTIASPVPLGDSTETPGTFYVVGGELRLKQNESNRWSGFQWTACAPITASVQIRLQNSTTNEWYEKEIPLAELVGETFEQPMDSQGNRLVLRRVGGDELAVVPRHDSLVFGPGELLSFDLYPRFVSAEFDGTQYVELSLCQARTEEKIPYTQQIIPITANASDYCTPVSVRLPHKSGVYDIVLALKRKASEDSKIARRTVQVVVVDSVNHWTTSIREPGNLSALKTEEVFTLDGSDPQWSHGKISARETPYGTLTTLADASDWVMYSIPIRQVNEPHVLEVEYLSTDSQSLGISILERSENGGLDPVSIDSGVDRADEITDSTTAERILTHRILFWPKTPSPLVLLSNQQERRVAAFGKIRLYQATGSFPKAFTENSGRLFAAYLHRPTFAENFGATRKTGEDSTDWVTFFEGVNRFSDYLQSVGYNGAMISVCADGSTIYPGETVASTPKFDSGVLLADGEDPIRKDVVELVARVFDREKLTLLPAIDFNAPIPRLEEHIRQARSDQETPAQFAGRSGYYWVGPNGNTITQTRKDSPGGLPYYNLLHPAVQEEMLNTVLEILVRYGNHSSLGGIAVQLSADGFAQLPEECWGMDDFTIALFQEETQIRIPVSATENRFAERYEYIRTRCLESWIRWRAKKVAAFYRKMCQMIVHFRPDARLYLSGATLLDGEHTQNAFYPVLSRKPDTMQTLLVLGFDLDALKKERSLVFLRPWRTSFSGQPATVAAQMEMEQAELFAPLYRNENGAAAIFYNHNNAVRLPFFEQNGPTQPAENRFTPQFTFQTVPSAEQNRKRFLRELAKSDMHTCFDGGQFLSLGQEDSLADLIAVFRRLPVVPFQTYTPRRPLENAGYTPQNVTNYGTIQLAAANNPVQTTEHSTMTPPYPDSIQPLVVRYAHTEGETIAYIVNNAAFHVEAKITFTANSETKLTELTGRRDIPDAAWAGRRLTWRVVLKPYDLLAVRLSDPASVPVDVAVKYSDEICGPQGKLRQVFDTLIYAIDHPIPWSGPENSVFEAGPEGGTQIPGWTKIGNETFTAKIDGEHKKSGNGSLQMIGFGPSGGVVSNSFPSPQTGRLFVHFWVGLEEETERCPLRLALTGRDRNSQTPFLRTVPLEQMVSNALENVVPIDGVRWFSVTVPFTQLPLNSLENLAIRLDLTAEGTVWIDEIRLDSIAFTESERMELLKMISVASYLPTSNRVSDSVELLEGFWAQLLLENNIETPSLLASARLAAPRPPYAAEYRGGASKKVEPPKKPTPQTEKSPSFFSRFKFW
ncbi:MAG: family 10 glycosylhydrolase [Planctomycetaceae bacterium]|nr:family 10 glycosylhydrolase [Planctomycetaceae bacterium]